MPMRFKDKIEGTITNADYASSAGSVAWSNVSGKPSAFTPASHTHNYAGSASAGGSANSAVKLDTATAGSTTQPVYFSGGKPVAIGYTIQSSVPANAKFTDTNTTYDVFKAATASAAGGTGLVPAPAAGQQNYFLRGDKTWQALSKSSVGLGNVDNTADSAKSVKYATSAGSANAVAWSNVSGKPTTFSPASHTHKYASGFSVSGTTVTVSYGDGTSSTFKTQDTNTTYSVFKAATTDAAGGTGLVPAPAAGAQGYYLAGDATWKAFSKSTVGLGNVDNTADSAKNVRYATSAGSANSVAWGNVSGKPSTFTPASHTHKYASGFSVSGTTVTVSYGDGSSSTFTTQDTNTTYNVFTGATASAAGGTGLVPAPAKGQQGYYLAGDSTWKAFSKSTVGLGNVDNTADSSKSVKYATSAGSANSVAWGNVSGKPTTFAPASHTHNYAGSASAGGSANSAVKLDTATAGSSTQPVYFSGGKPAAIGYTIQSNVPANAKFTDTVYTHPTTAGNKHIPAGGSRSQYLKWNSDGAAAWSYVKEADLSWGGGNHAGSFGCIDAAMIPDLGANRFAFGNAAGIKAEYSNDNGSTWTDYGADNTMKTGLFANGSSFYIGKATSTGSVKAGSMLRVTIDTDKFGIYTVLNKFAIYLSTNGHGGCYCTIDASLESDPTNFVTFANKVAVSGWSGWNIINTSGLTAYGNSNNKDSQYGLIRFTFGITSANSNTNGMVIYRIMGFGGVGWITPSTMARIGTIYSYDASQNVTFPAKVTATGFNGTADSAKKLTTNAGSATNPVYFSNGVPVATTYTLGKSVPSNAVFTDTNTWRGIQDNLTSTATDQSLSANQGKVLKGLVDGKAPASHTHKYASGFSVSGTTVTVSYGDGSSSTFKTQDTNTTYSDMKGATSSAAGTHGLVPAPAAGAQTKYLRGDGTWQTPPDTNTTYSVFKGATSSAAGGNGLVPAPASGATSHYLKSTGAWGQVAWGEISGKPSTFTPASHTHTKSQITDFPTSLPASDVYAWAKASTKPSYSWNEISSKPSTFTPASHTHNYAGSASAGGSATSAVAVVDYGDTSKTIQIGYGGSGITGDNIKYIAGYTTGDGANVNAKIKDISKDALKGWLGLGSAAYTASSNYAASSHTHNYAGSGSAGGSANSAVKLDTTTAGSATKPVYFSGGKPVACTYTLGKSVPSNAVFTDTHTLTLADRVSGKVVTCDAIPTT